MDHQAEASKALRDLAKANLAHARFQAALSDQQERRRCAARQFVLAWVTSGRSITRLVNRLKITRQFLHGLVAKKQWHSERVYQQLVEGMDWWNEQR